MVDVERAQLDVERISDLLGRHRLREFSGLAGDTPPVSARWYPSSILSVPPVTGIQNADGRHVPAPPILRHDKLNNNTWSN